MIRSFAEKLRKLQKLKASFSEGAEQQRLLLLEMLARMQPGSAQCLIQYHDMLLFLLAFPDSPKLAEKATQEMLRLKYILSKQGKKSAFSNSGLEFTTLSWKPSPDALHWLLSRFNDLRYTVKSSKKLEEITTLLCYKTEWDSLLDAEVSFQQWISRLSAREVNAPSRWLKVWLNRFQKLGSAPAVRDFLFDSLSMKAICTLSGAWSLTSNKLLFGQPCFYKKKPEIKKNEILKPVFLNDKISQRVLNSIKAALFARQKETDPVTYADERFLYGYETDDGFTVYLLSMKPENRLPLESYIGYMVYSNGIPVSYGGGWIFYEQCEFGINIFEQFRGGPSARILHVLMNVYKHHYGVKTFIIPPYQFGEGNRDGIKSGAFWFYYKMGFRPVNKELKLLAEREWKKIQNNKAYRTPEKVLIRFTEGPVISELKNNLPVPELKKLSHAAIKWIAENFDGNQKEASKKSADRLLKKSGISTKGWSISEKNFFQELAPFLCMIHGWEKWKQPEIKQAVMLLKEKGREEHRFIRMLQQHQKLRKEFFRISKG
ncbi:MAG: hypothetical protein JNL47_11170 [Bacteroidia bacterium]|nr:hypothetical protein [Bacteroidia bacterium]